MRYGYKYSVRAHARGHDRYTAQAVHAIKLYVYKYNVRAQTRVPKHNRYRCTCTRTSCEPRHVDLSTVGASPRLSMPVHATGLRKSVHRLGCRCQNTVQVVQAQYLRASTSTHVYYAHHPGCPYHILYNARIHVLTTSGATLGLHRPTTVHAHIHMQDTLLGLSKPNTVPHVNTRKI